MLDWLRPIAPNWNFFVSVGEALTLGDPDAVWLTVEWDAPLPIISDYLVVPPFRPHHGRAVVIWQSAERLSR